MKNMGFMKMRLINPPPELTDEARWFACNSVDVLESAETFSDFRTAVSDISIVVGTSRRTGKRRGVILPADKAASVIIEKAKTGKVAILFGREDRGLLNEEVDECGLLLTIPTSSEHRSLNLAQAVLIIAYELLKAGYNSADADVSTKKKIPPRMYESGQTGTRLVSHADLGSLFERMTSVLRMLEYIPRGDRDLESKIMQNLKHFISRAGLTDWELNMLHGILAQIEKKVGK
jgi:TrmH family RNA methyltransferase